MGLFEVLIEAGNTIDNTLTRGPWKTVASITTGKDRSDKTIFISFVSLDNENIPCWASEKGKKRTVGGQTKRFI